MAGKIPQAVESVSKVQSGWGDVFAAAFSAL